MTQPLDVAYVEIKPDLKDFSRDVSRETDKAFNRLERSASDSSDNIEKSFRDTAERIGDLFKGSDGRLRDAQGRFAAIGDAATNALGAISDVGSTATRSLSQIGGILTGMLGTIGQLASAGPAGIAVLVAAFVALAAAAAAAAAVVQNLIIIIGAAAAALPGLITAAVAGFAILGVALNGVVDAFQEQSEGAKKAGAAGVNSARQIADAQRGVLQAQKDLIRAREDEIKRVRTLAVELNRARVTESRAIDDVKNAQLELEDARKLGSPRAEKEAQLRLDEANATLLEAKDRTKNLAAEKAKADRTGIDGSDKVLAAQEALIDAQDRLAASMQKVGGGAAQQKTAFDGLTKSAQGFVLALVAAKNELGPVADSIQEAFFKGTAPLIDPIVENIKSVQPELDRVAGGFGKIFQEILKFLGGDKAQDALKKILDGLANFLDKVAPAIGPLLDAFAELAGESGEFGDELGGTVADALLGIAKFVKDVDLKQVFKDAKEAIKELIPLIKPLLSILLDLFKIFADLGKFILPAIAIDLKIVAVVVEFLTGVWGLLLEDLKKVGKFLLENIPKAFAAAVAAVKSAPESIKALGTKFLEAGKSLISKLFEGFGAAGGFIGELGKKIANNVIKFINNNVINNINSAVQKIQDGINSIPFVDDVSLPKIPRIPQLAKGGVTTGHTLAEIGEKGRTEAVLPLEDPRAMQRVGSAIASAGGTSGGGSGDTLVANIYLGNEHVDTRVVKVVRKNNRRVARNVKQVPRMV